MISVRAAKPSDARALVAHLAELVAEPGINIPLAPDEILTLDEERDMLADFAASPRARMLVAEADGELVGELSIKAISTRRAVLHVATLGMSVKQAWRRHGVGRALMSEAIAWAPSVGITRIELYVYARNTPAIRLYEQFGFVVEGQRRGFIREGGAYVDDLVMARVA